MGLGFIIDKMIRVLKRLVVFYNFGEWKYFLF
jgi:hypothetical protein